MKIKLAYPKIPDTLDCPLRECVAFEKLDGTNIHFIFRKTGFLEFGTRRDRFPYSPEGWASFKQAHPELSSLQDDSLDLIVSIEEYFFSNEKYKEANEVVVFFEYCGPNSFAGQHQDKDEKKLYLIDSQIDGRMLPPEEFLEDFKGCDYYLPKVVFQGKFTGQLFVDVRKGKYDVKEGVVVKGLVGKEVYMAKIKTEAYMDRLKDKFDGNWKNYWE